MQKCYLDSNIIVAFKDEAQHIHDESVSLLDRLVTDQISLFTSPLALDEFLHTARLTFLKSTTFPFRHLKKALTDILEIPKLIIINPPVDSLSQLEIINLMEKYSLRPRDAYHLLIMQTNSIDGFATFDTDFKKVFTAKILTKA